jgi:hypothetical protein
VSALHVHVLYAIRNAGQAIRASLLRIRGFGKDAQKTRGRG